MPQIPDPPLGPGLTGTLGTPDPTLPGAAGNDQVSLEQAWSLYQTRIHVHDPALRKQAATALDSVNTLMRSHG